MKGTTALTPKQVQPCWCPWECVVEEGQPWENHKGVVFDVRSVTKTPGAADAEVELLATDWPHSRQVTTASVLCGAGKEAWTRLVGEDDADTSIFNKTIVGLGPDRR